MKKQLKKGIAFLGTSLLLMGLITGCSNKATDTTNTASTGGTTTQADTSQIETTGSTAKLSGSVLMVGSTSMEKFANALAETFMADNSGVTIQAEFSGSSAGVEAALGGSADIGNSSRNLTDDEKTKGAVENIVAIDGIAVIADPANTVSDLTKNQLVNIYNGTTTNWKDLGGQDQPIVVVGRESGSGTRGAFEEILELKDACKYSNELNSTGAVIAKIASTPGSIGYVSLDVIDNTVKALSLDSVEPTADNIKAGTYFLNRPFVMATKGEITEQSELVQALFNYIFSDKGTELVQSVGLIPVK